MLSNDDVLLYPKIGMLSIGDDLSVRAIVNSTALHNAAYALKPSLYLPLINSAVDNGGSDQQGSSKRDISCAKQVVKYGTSANKQVFNCKGCQHKFREESILQKVKFSPELITLTLDFSGLALRKISSIIKACFFVL